MPRLQQLELVVSSGGSSNLLDGDQWETLISDRLPLLSTFDFKFKIINIDRDKHDAESVLARFRSPFWLDNHRRWHVAFDIQELILYTVPHFVPHIVKHPFYVILPHPTTLPIEQQGVLYDRVTEFELGSGCKSSHRYTQLRKLTLLIPTIDENVIDLSPLEYLCVKTDTWSLKRLFQLIRQSMPRLYHLKIDCDLSWIQSRDVFPLEQIHTLDLPQFSSSPKNDEIDLSWLFPHVERLMIDVSTCFQMGLLIDRFTHLSSASFHIVNYERDMTHTVHELEGIRQWLVKNTSRLATNKNFTYRLDSPSWVHLWISVDNRQLAQPAKTSSPGAQRKTVGEDDQQKGCFRRCLLQ